MKPEELYELYVKLEKTDKKDFIALLFEDYNSDILVNALNSNTSTTRFPEYININELKSFLNEED